MQPTKLLYLENFNLFASEANILEVVQENGKDIVLLDQTIFYPQGGGQPYDKGINVWQLRLSLRRYACKQPCKYSGNNH